MFRLSRIRLNGDELFICKELLLPAVLIFLGFLPSASHDQTTTTRPLVVNSMQWTFTFQRRTTTERLFNVSLGQCSFSFTQQPGPQMLCYVFLGLGPFRDRLLSVGHSVQAKEWAKEVIL